MIDSRPNLIVGFAVAMVVLGAMVKIMSEVSKTSKER